MISLLRFAHISLTDLTGCLPELQAVKTLHDMYYVAEEYVTYYYLIITV